MLKNKKIICTIEARMGATRFPGKVLMFLSGEPSLKRMVDRIRQSKYINEVIIATTLNKVDEAIVKFCQKNKIKCYRGSENDVLDRIYQAAKYYKGEAIVALTGDCPLVDFRHINRVVKTFLDGKWDYVANALERSYPDGFDVQILSREVLSRIWQLAKDPIERVHSTYYIAMHPNQFKIKKIRAEGKMHWPQLGLTLDEIADYKLIDIIFQNLLPKDPFFSARKIINFLNKNKHLLKINQNVRRKKPEEG